jgi:hypothetical protein
MFREKEIKIIFIYFTDDENVDEIVRRFTSHVLETTTDDEE